MVKLGTALIGAMVFFSILYYIVRSAVEDGMLKALMKYDKLKDEKNRNDQIN